MVFVGIVVPGYSTTKDSRKDMLDPSNLVLLEATAGGGIVARPLLTRLEMSQSRSVILLPLASSGERRYDEDYEPNESTKRMHAYLRDRLVKFRDKWVKLSETQNYKSAHSIVSIAGAMAFATGLYPYSPGPVSPSAWLVVHALKDAAVALPASDKETSATKVEDFLRDHRFSEDETVRLRPGWKFLTPVILRENS